MLRSMFSGVSGLRNHQTKMDVLGNNIANVNTQGFKASRVTFQELYTQTLAPAAAPAASGQIGGLNARQVGLGVSAASIDVLHSVGAAQTTDRTLDLMIDGEGFFSVKNGEDTYYTRAGNLYLDEFGYLIMPNGFYVQGIMLIDYEAPSDFAISEQIDERLSSDESIKWAAAELESISTQDGGLPMYVTDETREERDELFGSVVIPSWYQNIAISPTGVITAENENGETVEVAVLSVTTFVNSGGLTRRSDNLYTESPNSGVPATGIPGLGSSGFLKVGALEMSNVDLSKEFTDMIITQRGFQANSRTITVSDTLLEELINLKR